MSAPEQQLDDFADVSGWSAIVSGLAMLRLAADAGPDGGKALRLDYDFKGGAGFVVARKRIARSAMPAAWAITLRTRGAAPANKLEVKLIDRTGSNVWWWKRDAFVFTPDWQPLRVRSSEVEFAWGPAGGGTLSELDAVEIAIVAGPGGRGSVWLSDLRFEDLSLREAPRASASSSVPGHLPQCVLDASVHTSWRSAPDARSAWLALDFGGVHEYGGLIVDWGARGAPRSFDVESSDDALAWKVLASCRQASGPRSYIHIAGGMRSRQLRLHLLEASADTVAASEDSAGFEIRALAVQPFDFSRSLPAFFHAVAACEPRGHHPRWLHREQSYWTPVGLPGSESAAILNEEGMLEPDQGSFSLEPFLFADGRLITWADAEVSVSLAEHCLPLPAATWRCGDLDLTTNAYAAMIEGERQVRVQYRVANHAAHARRLRLFAALRPFQVTPPWQSLDGRGGVVRIDAMAWRDGAVHIDDDKRIVPIDTPIGFGVAAFEQGGVMRHLAAGELPPHAATTDAFGHASGALAWDLDLPSADSAQIELAIAMPARPALGAVTPEPAAAAIADLAGARGYWHDKLGGLRIKVGGAEPECITVLRTAAAHVLVNRDGAALQPGPRRYMRSWIRDGATMSAALLRMGCSAEVRDYLAWYATHQRDDGNVPCVVDRSGPDWLPEHDSHGQFVFTLAEYFRFTGDVGFLEAMWPAARRAIGYLEWLRAQRCTDDFRSSEREASFGILPESASHEGYLAQPVHAYWDDFWALRGIGDAIELAQALDLASETARLRALYDDFDRCLYASIRATIAARGLNYVPGSVEWADFDPSATATAVAITDPGRLPAKELAWTFDEHLRTVHRRHTGTQWTNYSAYEIRILGALLRLGRRDEAQELLRVFLADRRPRAWNQWPEISWRDPRSPGHLGDVPHSWIGAEYVLAVLASFAYERPADQALVIGAGISDAWLNAGEIVVQNLPTWWGRLSYSMRRVDADALQVEIEDGLSVPPGGIVLRPPLRGVLKAVEVDGMAVAGFAPEGVTLRRVPASALLRWSDSPDVGR